MSRLSNVLQHASQPIKFEASTLNPLVSPPKPSTRPSIRESMIGTSQWTRQRTALSWLEEDRKPATKTVVAAGPCFSVVLRPTSRDIERPEPSKQITSRIGSRTCLIAESEWVVLITCFSADRKNKDIKPLISRHKYRYHVVQRISHPAKSLMRMHRRKNFYHPSNCRPGTQGPKLHAVGTLLPLMRSGIQDKEL